MLSYDDNERLTRVGPGSPAGQLFRRYWQPALMSEELPENDCPPVRVRLLGEDLVAFRDTEGRVGLVDSYCPHRRAPLFFGRNEECGIRCVYHGWKFDVDGNCVDLPSEPPGSPMKNKAKLKAYPTHERGGLIWAYLGPAEARPPEPDFEWTRAPDTHRFVSKTLQASNYLQALEGGLDTAHVTYLHNDDMANRNNLFTKDGAPEIAVFETEYGYHYVSTRRIDADRNFVRVYQYIMPFQQMRPNTSDTGRGTFKLPRYDGHIWVPIDDQHTWVYNFMCGYDANAALDTEFVEKLEATYGRGQDDFVPGTYKLKADLSNDYFIDRTKQKNGSYTGIRGINTQDMALQEGMGPVVDRSQEFLGTSDKAIIAMRKLLLEATRAVERGETPRGLESATYRGVRPHDGLVPAGADWREEFAEQMSAKW